MSWWQLDSIIKEQAAYVEYYRSIEPVACPHDGTPLKNGPPQHEAVKYCPFCKWVYPRDYNEITQAGM